MIYRKRPVEIEAVQFLEDNGLEIVRFMEGSISDAARFSLTNTKADRVVIETLEGDMTAKVGDWIIRGLEGEFYPCKASIFEATYEEV